MLCDTFMGVIAGWCGSVDPDWGLTVLTLEAGTAVRTGWIAATSNQGAGLSAGEASGKTTVSGGAQRGATVSGGASAECSEGVGLAVVMRMT